MPSRIGTARSSRPRPSKSTSVGMKIRRTKAHSSSGIFPDRSSERSDGRESADGFWQRPGRLTIPWWGSSHGFRYRADDRKGGVYRWFEKEETSVLPGSVAANPYNPELEVIQMLSKKQIEALREIGGDKIVDLVTETGEKRTEELERAGVAYKAKKAGDLPSQLEAIAAEMEDEDMAKELRKLAGKIAKAVSKGKKEEPAEETEPTAADIPSGLGEF